MRLVIKGTVQGVGFRPTVYRVARALNLNGHVKNKGGQVEVVIDGDHKIFLNTLMKELPPLARVTGVDMEPWDNCEPGFRIIPSEEGKSSSTIPVDTALCEHCLAELINPSDRRKDFPFINCTNCGARYSAIRGLPYDRPKTTMAPFPMCERCSEEYHDPSDRRFHAQTTSCPDCGPRYTLHAGDGRVVGGIREFAMLLDREIGRAHV